MVLPGERYEVLKRLNRCCPALQVGQSLDLGFDIPSSVVAERLLSRGCCEVVEGLMAGDSNGGKLATPR
jgi:hypothetical protein